MKAGQTYYCEFLSTLSLRRATVWLELFLYYQEFLSTLSLRRATANWFDLWGWAEYFYPRSPCGERLNGLRHRCANFYFYPRSPCGERPANAVDQILPGHISIHALLAESDRPQPPKARVLKQFLSTLSLRRATLFNRGLATVHNAFLSTLSLRRATAKLSYLPVLFCISIHALLAESDVTVLGIQHKVGISIHALLAESDPDQYRQ